MRLRCWWVFGRKKERSVVFTIESEIFITFLQFTPDDDHFSRLTRPPVL